MFAAIMEFWETTLFPPIMEFLTKSMRPSVTAVMAHASGRVLEIGSGTGANHGGYPSAVTEVVGIEPVAKMVATANKRVETTNHPYPIKFQVGDAEKLPFEDGSFDCCLACLVFCSILDPAKAAAEARRVLKPGGKLLFFEHVASHSPFWLLLQKWLDPLWGITFCGCLLTRDTRSTFESAGFHIEDITDEDSPRESRIISRQIRGVARK